MQALPVILIISVLCKLLHHWRLLQPVVRAVGRALQRVFGITDPVGT